MLVPTVAFQQDLAGMYLMTVDGENKVVKKIVKTGPRVRVDDREMRIIEEGLEGDERIIVIGLLILTVVR